MKKIFIILSFLVIVYFYINRPSEDIVIPNDAIRFRVLANSNSVYDQEIKIKVRDEVSNVVYNLLKDTTDVKEARNIINSHLPKIDISIKDLLDKENYNYGYKINYGYNYFPSKEYKGLIYNAGDYESLLITLGSGEGDNWWCVMFPPFCLLEAEEGEEVEYDFKVKELINKYF